MAISQMNGFVLLGKKLDVRLKGAFPSFSVCVRHFFFVSAVFEPRLGFPFHACGLSFMLASSVCFPSPAWFACFAHSSLALSVAPGTPAHSSGRPY